MFLFLYNKKKWATCWFEKKFDLAMLRSLLFIIEIGTKTKKLLKLLLIDLKLVKYQSNSSIISNWNATCEEMIFQQNKKNKKWLYYMVVCAFNLGFSSNWKYWFNLGNWINIIQLGSKWKKLPYYSFQTVTSSCLQCPHTLT